MKKLLSTLAIAAASTALAVESSNTFGILRVDSSAAQTIVSVPWEGAGATGETANKIKVKDVVKTANLTPASGEYIGDQLYYYNGSSYKMWRLTSTGWEGATTVANGITPTEGTDEDELTRGGAIILVRKNPTTGNPAVANPFYLYGQYTNAASSTTCVAGGYTLLAPPSTDETDLNTKTWSNVNVNDNIVLANGTLLHYRNSQWGKLSKTLNESTGVISESLNTGVAKIAAGEGAWYISKGSTAPSVTWVAAPQQ